MMKLGELFDGGDAELAHLLRQAGQRLAHAVLHLHLRQVDVGADLEGDGEREHAVRGGLRRHVEHVLDAVDLLLERRRDGLGRAPAGWRRDRSRAPRPRAARPRGTR